MACRMSGPGMPVSRPLFDIRGTVEQLDVGQAVRCQSQPFMILGRDTDLLEFRCAEPRDRENVVQMELVAQIYKGKQQNHQAERELTVSLDHGPDDALDDFHQPGVGEAGQINPSVGYQTFGSKQSLRVEGPGFNLGDQGSHVFIRHGLLFSQLEIDLGRLRLVGLAIGLGEAREAIADQIEDFLLRKVIGIAHHLKGFLQFGACSGGEKASLMSPSCLSLNTTSYAR